MKIALFANTDWYLYNFRQSFAETLRDAGHDVLLVSPPGEYAERLRARGFAWRSLPMERRSLNPFREFQVLVLLCRLLRQEKIDLLHSFTIKCAIYGALAARLTGNRKRISAVAGLGYIFTSRDLRARLLRPLVRVFMRLAFGGRNARVILQNADDAAIFRRWWIVKRSRMRLIRGSGVDCRRFSRRGTREPGEPLRVLLAARLLWGKGVGEYAEASRLLQAQGRHVRCLLAGNPDAGNPDAVPESVVRAWQQEGLVEWLGHVEDMAELLAGVHVMTLPTAYGEGLPKSLIEAGACGLALVTTDTPGCRDVVEDNASGLLVPVRDARALAAALARLDDDPGLMLALGDAAKARAAAHFDERAVIAKTLAVYEELAGAPV